VNIAPPVRRAQTKVTPMEGQFSSLGDFLTDVRLSTVNKRPTERIRNAAPASAGNEGTGADGGFIVPPEVGEKVMAAVEAVSLVGLCRTIPSRTNAPVLPVDSDPIWDAAGVYYDAELTAADEYKAAFQQRSFRLKRLTTFLPASSELFEDAPAWSAWCNEEVPRRIAAKLTNGIIRGTGSGQITGILGHPATIVVARGMSVTASAAAMFKRMYSAGRKRAIWIAHPEVEIPPSTPGMPGQWLHGLPVEYSEHASAAGQAGDLMLLDLSQYLILAKAAKSVISSEFYFDSDSVAFRCVLRIDGLPLWESAKTPAEGSTSLSPFVVLDT
jgi:hypothetical protein